MNKVNTMHINKLAESQDLDSCLGYLSLVNGIDGALVYNHEGLVVAVGENTLENLPIEGPYFLSNFLENLRQCKLLGLNPLDHQVVFSDHKFYQIINLERTGLFFLMVTGTRGSYELFKFRIERGAQAVAHLLHERGYLRG
jgi:hypothetical protein